ncbi:nuclear transport factor 2 family protein [Lysobacter sp. 5GHs7-4]|uniref:nuclear transport factor 2 family protein n=1 Tax=Lysobacter sp. 5GHs7-4 TaxID=2904253 RepID=UPI001E5848E7|nr:nuclear transport factor 2 family protein [Lysobacter sp. 5GHs7-4]UHQ23074.1 nuclear transport factor 2 family protein [Lysobacter sp. 5GHs7-4]
MNTEQVAQRLVELCRKGEFDQAQNELYADNAVSVEPAGAPDGMGDAHGMDAIREKGRRFAESIEAYHGVSVSDPLIAENWFSVSMGLDVTMKGMGRIDMKEICVYRVKDGKIVHEQFFYDVG